MNTLSIVMPEIKKEKISNEYGEDRTRRYPTNGDDSFYSSSDSAASTSSPTSSITSQGSRSGESDEGIFVEKNSNAEKLKAIKNLHNFSNQNSLVNFSFRSSNNADMPLDLSCHQRAKKDKLTTQTNITKNDAHLMANNLNNNAHKTSDVASNSFPLVPFTYPPYMFSWPYFMPPVTSTQAGLPAFAPPVLPGRYLNPGLFTSQTSAASTSSATFSQQGYTSNNRMTTSTAHHPTKPTSLQGLLSSNTSLTSSTLPTPNLTTSQRNQNPMLLAEFARVFSAQADQIKSTETIERRRKNANPSRIQPAVRPPNGLNENIFSSREQLYRDMPTMANVNQFPNVFQRCQDNKTSLKRKSPNQHISDISWQQANAKKVKQDTDHYSSHSGSPKSDYEREGVEVLRQPKPTTFQPCRIPCTKCGRTYATTGALAKHMKTHDDPDVENKFNCKICQKECSSLGALRMHIRTHTLPCECHICGKAFSRTWLLQGHIRTHTGEKPYQCTVCSRAFADRSNLRAHMQTHETIKRYGCVTCDKTFSRISLLKRHQVNCDVNKAIPL